MQECNHPNVVRYLGSLRARDALWIVMEYCGGGSASDLMHASEAPLDEQLINYICAETLKVCKSQRNTGRRRGGNGN
jgi:serine/threonine-protein kinase 24/25/MST4